MTKMINDMHKQRIRKTIKEIESTLARTRVIFGAVATKYIGDTKAELKTIKDILRVSNDPLKLTKANARVDYILLNTRKTVMAYHTFHTKGK